MGYNEKSPMREGHIYQCYMKSIEMSQKSKRWVLGPYRNKNKSSLERCRYKELISNKTKKSQWNKEFILQKDKQDWKTLSQTNQVRQMEESN